MNSTDTVTGLLKANGKLVLDHGRNETEKLLIKIRGDLWQVQVTPFPDYLISCHCLLYVVLLKTTNLQVRITCQLKTR